MNFPNLLSSLRIVFSVIFFIIWLLFLDYRPYNSQAPVGAIILLGIFVLCEFTDLLDGMVARNKAQISDTGKLLDPFADVFFHLTCFYCLQLAFIIPVWVFVIILWREISMLFIRMILAQKNHILAARFWGKAKSFLYFIICTGGLISLIFATKYLYEWPFDVFAAIVYHASNLAAFAALASFIPYLQGFIKFTRSSK